MLYALIFEIAVEQIAERCGDLCQQSVCWQNCQTANSIITFSVDIQKHLLLLSDTRSSLAISMDSIADSQEHLTYVFSYIYVTVHCR